MCGIAGLVSEEADLGELVMAMTGALSHRGPDDQGFAVFGPEVSASRLVTPELRSSSKVYASWPLPGPQRRSCRCSRQRRHKAPRVNVASDKNSIPPGQHHVERVHDLGADTRHQHRSCSHGVGWPRNGSLSSAAAMSRRSASSSSVSVGGPSWSQKRMSRPPAVTRGCDPSEALGFVSEGGVPV